MKRSRKKQGKSPHHQLVTTHTAQRIKHLEIEGYFLIPNCFS